MSGRRRGGREQYRTRGEELWVAGQQGISCERAALYENAGKDKKTSRNDARTRGDGITCYEHTRRKT